MNDLKTMLTQKVTKKTTWKTYPTLLNWYELGRMTNVTNIIEKKVKYLFEQGARSKVTEWISNDTAMTQITAERYILDYLRINNTNFSESFTGGGVDGYLKINDSRIGLEVTTVNQSIAEWILQERLLIYLRLNNYSIDNGIEITYDLSKIEPIKFNKLDIVEKLGKAIIRKNYHTIDGISISRVTRKGAYISWNNIDSDNNFFPDLSKKLRQIISQKSKQLAKNKQNILFIGVNQLPHSIFNPDIFRELAGQVYHQEWIFELEKIVKDNLPKNVVGICFFVYTLESEEMMYPLKIIWTDNSNYVSTNL